VGRVRLQALSNKVLVDRDGYSKRSLWIAIR
jgi:hypothetical protein